jgi:hypothetical protein
MTIHSLKNTFTRIALLALALTTPLAIALAEESPQQTSQEGKPPLVLQIPEKELLVKEREKELTDVVTAAPAKPYQDKQHGGSEVIDTLSRFRLQRDEEEGRTAVEYQFKRKSQAAREADARSGSGVVVESDERPPPLGVEIIEKITKK